MAIFKRKQKNIESVPDEATERKEEEQHMATTLEQVRKAYQDLSEEDKKTFHQSLKDRVDESVADQEREEGDEDSQNAKDRVDEALGAKRADERREEAKRDSSTDEIMRRLDEITRRLDKYERSPERADKEAVDKLKQLERKYMN